MKKILLLIFVLTVSSANAGVLLEPYVGYVIGSVSDDNTIANDKFYRHYNSPTFGARAGYQMLGFMGGIEYNMSSSSWEDQITNGGLGPDIDVKGHNLGAFVGFNFPIMLRVWATYYFNSKAEYDSGADKGSFYSGNGKTLGVGFTGLPFVSINLEYRMIKYDKYETTAGVVMPLNGVDETNASEFFIGASLPFNIDL